MKISLDGLSLGECGTVESISAANGNLKNRLIALGFSPGAEVRKTMVSPLRDPCAYLVKGSVIALRGCDAAKILVNVEENDED